MQNAKHSVIDFDSGKWVPIARCEDMEPEPEPDEIDDPTEAARCRAELCLMAIKTALTRLLESSDALTRLYAKHALEAHERYRVRRCAIVEARSRAAEEPRFTAAEIHG